MNNVIEILEARGFVEAMTSEEVRQLASNPLTLYVGFDPTAESLHLGNLVGILALAWFQRAGHKVIALIGGATGMIGDPSGKSLERSLLDKDSLKRNVAGVARSLEAVLGLENVHFLNNLDWFEQFTFIEFLRDVGKHFRLSTMLAKEAVRSRLGSEEGMSFTEFSYQLLQAYDFLHLHEAHGVSLQLGGSDQWGNITAGTELVRKIRGKTVHGMTFPLLTRSDGKKFGKSEEGAIWLNRELLSPYDFYQYLYRQPDEEMGKLLRMLTFLDLAEIAAIEKEMKTTPNLAQRRLAEEVTRIVHGEKGLEEALRITSAAKPGAKTTLDLATFDALAHELPTETLPRGQVVGVRAVDLFALVKLVGSKGEARRLIQNGGAYINNEKVSDEQALVEENALVSGQFLLLSAGKKKKMIVKIEKS